MVGLSKTKVQQLKVCPAHVHVRAQHVVQMSGCVLSCWHRKACCGSGKQQQLVRWGKPINQCQTTTCKPAYATANLAPYGQNLRSTQLTDCHSASTAAYTDVWCKALGLPCLCNLHRCNSRLHTCSRAHLLRHPSHCIHCCR
jgi:hypothetical protein